MSSLLENIRGACLLQAYSHLLEGVYEESEEVRHGEAASLGWRAAQVHKESVEGEGERRGPWRG